MNRTYAVGDVHGCLAQLQNLVQQCERDAGAEKSRFIFLGDYIDRGPDSRGVIDFLMDLQTWSPDEVICLMGNHEDLLLAAVDDSDWEKLWLQNGGIQTLSSFRASNAIDIPSKHLKWLGSRPTFFDDGLRFFVHAGVHPDHPLDQQDDYDLLNIRQAFLTSKKDFGRLIVHGHTPTSNGLPDARSNRLNLDTGAVFGRRLTAAMFTDDAPAPQKFFSAPTFSL